MRIDWHGIFPALSTPCDDTGALDEESLRNEVRWNIEKGAHGLIVSIMAGEFHKFSDEERKRCYEIVVEEAKGKVPVLAGTSHSGTEVVIQLSQYAKEIGVDGIVVLPPYFNLQDGKAALSLYDHYATIARRIDIPIMIQDCEGTGPFMCTTLFKRLADDFKNIVAVKLEGPTSFQKALEMREMAPDVVLFGGMAAANMLEELKIGVAGNVPDACLTDVLVGVYENFKAGNLEEAEKLFKRYKVWLNFLQLHRLSNYEVEKETLRQRRVIKSSYTRLPRGPLLTDEDQEELNRILRDLGLL
ncbi:MAG TPA: dihydrodipicolinate synthase family protein [Caldilineae bacterium]|nr:dihydrodipicolinate synthase family protein [Caldilineae bacterium]